MAARILVIEDNAANLELMVYLLGAFGHTAIAARNGEEGFQAALEHQPELILCDVHLPGMDGYEVVRRLRADPRGSSVPTVAVTALAMVGDRDRLLKAGFDGYISKPIQPETFVPEIEAFLSGIASRQPARYADSTSDTSRQRGDRAKILAVDNTPSNLEFLRSLLEPFGYQVRTAPTMWEALEAGELDVPDLIVSDICMSDGNGYDFLAMVKSNALLAPVPFVFLTSSMTGELDRKKGLGMGAVRFLVRPIEPECLLREIEGALKEGRRDGQDSGRG